MSLHHIVLAKGGVVYSNGLRASIPGPGHSKNDRSASLMIGRSGKVVVFSFGRSTTSEILDDLRQSGLVDAYGYPATSSGRAIATAINQSDRAKRDRAEVLWSEGCGLVGSLSAKYLRDHRALVFEPGEVLNLLHHPRCPLSIYQAKGRKFQPALMARIESHDGRLVGVELTYLDPLGRRDLGLRISRKTVGSITPGAFVALRAYDDEIVVGEGVMTTLSASQWFGLPGIALLGVQNLKSYMPAARVSRVLIAADRGCAGETAAGCLYDRLKLCGLSVSIVLPPQPFLDFNQWDQARQAEKKRGREKVD